MLQSRRVLPELRFISIRHSNLISIRTTLFKSGPGIVEVLNLYLVAGFTLNGSDSELIHR